MHYVVGDIHNNNRKFEEMLEKIGFSQEDHLYLLGDLFDRNSWEPDPIGVYFNMLKLENRCTVVRGNHDTWLAQYIMYYFNFPEKERKQLEPPLQGTAPLSILPQGNAKNVPATA